MPRPRFTLRVVLAVTAIVAVLAWQGSIVWRRKAAMRELPHTFILAGEFGFAPNKVNSLNSLRRLLGDRAVELIWVTPGKSAEKDLYRLRELFPEAEVDSSTIVW